MTPFERSRKALEGVDVRKLLEASNLPVEIATAIADNLEEHHRKEQHIELTMCALQDARGEKDISRIFLEYAQSVLLAK